MQKKLVDLLKNANNPSLHLLVVMLIEDDLGLLIQEAVNMHSKDYLTADGIVGYNTIKAILSIDEDVFAKTLMELRFDKNHKRFEQPNGEETIMSYLGRYEGTVIHWNRNETSITTPYGVYGKAFPNSKPIKYAQELAKKYAGKHITRRNLRQIALVNRNMSNGEKRKMRKLCWDFYKRNFMNPKVIALLDNKSNLSWFSCCVNAGKVRGAKVLQEAVHANTDGKIGNATIAKIKKAKASNMNINHGILDAMLKFYKLLISINPAEFGVFKNGWFSRILALR